MIYLLFDIFEPKFFDIKSLHSILMDDSAFIVLIIILNGIWAVSFDWSDETKWICVLKLAINEPRFVYWNYSSKPRRLSIFFVGHSFIMSELMQRSLLEFSKFMSTRIEIGHYSGFSIAFRNFKRSKNSKEVRRDIRRFIK